MNRRRLLQSAILLAGLAGIAIVVAQTFDAADEQVLPSVPALVVGALLSLIVIHAAARAWVSLFLDVVRTREGHLILRGTFYLGQLTKYLPAGSILQTASQVGLAPNAGVPIRRAAVAYPVATLGVVVSYATVSSGLALDSDLAGWLRLLALLGPCSVVFLHRKPMAWLLDRAHHLIKRIPNSGELPTQRDIVAFYLWALLNVTALCATYTVLLMSLDVDVNPFFVFCAFALSWLVGFLAVPIPAGVGIREAVLVALLPGIGTAPLLAASLMLRLLSIGAELLAVAGNKLAIRRYARHLANSDRPPDHPDDPDTMSAEPA